MADREVADFVLLRVPHLAHQVRVYRAFLGRVVRYLVGSGTRQFLDLGSGLPTVNNVHEVAQDLNPDCRVVYVDKDSRVVAEGQDLLTGNDGAAVVRADLRHPEQVFDAARRCGLLDLSMPIAVLATDVLHHIPDTDNPVQIMAAYMRAVCSGSYLSVAHRDHDEVLITRWSESRDFFKCSVPPLTLRSLVQITKFFDKLEILAPGIVPASLWRSEPDGDPQADPEIFLTYCGLGQKR
jgi:hypothetical protein